MSRMLRNAELHAAVLADPDDDAPRLVYADWLAERGDPRGEFITVQIARAKHETPELLARERALLDEHGAAWKAPFGHSRIEHRRGFVESVSTTNVAGLVTAVDNACVRVLWVHDPNRLVCETLRGLAPRMRLAEFHLTTLDRPPVAAFRALVDSLAGLRLLGVNGRFIANDHMDALLAAAAGGLADVDGLHITESWVFHLEKIAAWPRPLRELSIRYGAAYGFAKLVDAFARLEVLDVCSTNLTKADLRAILESQMPLRRLDLMKCAIDEDDARAIANTPRFAALQYLNLAHTKIGVAGLDALCESPYLPRDLELHIDGDVLGLEPEYDFDDSGRAYEGTWKGPIPERYRERFRVVLAGTSYR